MTRAPLFHAFEASALWAALIVVAVGLTWIVVVMLLRALHPRAELSGDNEAPARRKTRRFGAQVSLSRHRLTRKPAPVISRRPVLRLLLFLACGVAVPGAVLVALITLGPEPAVPVQTPRAFRASFTGASVRGDPTSYVSPTVGEQVWIRLEVDPGPEALVEPQIDIEAPAAIAFQTCTAHAEGKQRPGFVAGPDAHIKIGYLEVGATERVECEFSVEQRVPQQRVIQIALSASNRGEAETRRLFLERSGGKSGREAAEALIGRELRTSPAAWARGSFSRHRRALVRVGREWPLLSPRALHGLASLPGGRSTTLAHLWSDRSQPRGLIEFKAVIVGPVVAVETFDVGRSDRRSKRWIFPIGETTGSKAMAWCAVTRSTSQPKLREGTKLKVQAAVLGFAISRTSRRWAAMLDCPAVREMDGPKPKDDEAEQAGATTAPAAPGL